MGKKQRLKHRRGITCWLVWTWNDTEQPIVAIRYWRENIYEKKVVTSMSKSMAAACWWNAERAAMAWARRKGFQIIKERLA